MLACLSAALARKVSTADDQSGIIDIVVTASKINDNLQSVPVAITALSGEAREIKTCRASPMSSSTCPASSIPRDRSGAPNFVIRGTRQQGITGAQCGVAVYPGNVPSTSSTPIENASYDMQSAQVLKGSQGTLFGKTRLAARSSSSRTLARRGRRRLLGYHTPPRDPG